MDSEQTIFMKKPEGLTRILSIDEDVKELWQAQEIEAMWRHQLAAPIGIDLETVISVTGTELRKSPHFEAFRQKTFADLFRDPSPPLEVLKLTKEFTKQTLRDCEEGQLRELASALYYASYAAALIYHGQCIGSMSENELRPGFNWALRQGWIDEQTKKLISTALLRLF